MSERDKRLLSDEVLAPEGGWPGSRLPTPADLPSLVHLRGDGGWNWTDKDGKEVRGPEIDGGSGIVLAVSVPSPCSA